MTDDNDKDRFTYGFDAGNIVDGIVQVDPITGECMLVDDDGEKFYPQKALATMTGKRVRVTMVSFEALENLEKMYTAAQAALGKPD